MKCVLIFSTNLSEIFLILSRIQWDIIKNVFRPSSQALFTLVRFQWNFNFLGRFTKNTKISNFVKIRPVGVELFDADGQTKRHDGANSPFLQFFQKRLKGRLWGSNTHLGWQNPSCSHSTEHSDVVVFGYYLVHFPILHHALNNSVTNTGATCFFSWPNWARKHNRLDSLADAVEATSSWTVSDIVHFYKTIFLKMFVPPSPNDRLKHGILVW